MYKNFITSNRKYRKIAKKFLKYETSNMQPNIKIHWKDANNYTLTISTSGIKKALKILDNAINKIRKKIC